MRKEGSEFKTEFISEAGTFETNKDYFQFVELDNAACYIAVDGIDSDTDRESAQIVVSSILNKFTVKPAFSRRKIKEYIINAHKELKNESSGIGLAASMVLVVTNYSKMFFAVSGNARLYFFRNDTFKFRSKDQSYAQLMADAGKISEEVVNDHEERGNLLDFLGNTKFFKPIISKKYKLEEGDRLLLCTAGFWQNMIDSEMADALKDTKEPIEFLDNLEEVFLSRQEEEIDNYTLASIYACKLYKEGTNPKVKIVKKIALALIPVLMIGGVLLFSKIKSKNDKEKEVFNARQNVESCENNGDQYVKSGNFNSALSEYDNAQKEAGNINDPQKEAEIKKRYKITRLILDGDKSCEAKDYDKAHSTYLKARAEAAIEEKYDKKELASRIEKTENIIKALDLKDQGDSEFDKKDYMKAKMRYQKAKTIASKLSLNDLNNDLKKDLKELNNKINKQINQIDIKIPELKADSGTLVSVIGVNGQVFRLESNTAIALEAMRKQASLDGINPPLLLVESGYRSDAEQKVLFDAKVNQYIAQGYSRDKAESEAEIWVAPPGCSAHRTGRTVDLNMSLSSDAGNAQALKKTKEYAWLIVNAPKFGFHNYEVEPWHWEYGK